MNNFTLMRKINFGYNASAAYKCHIHSDIGVWFRGTYWIALATQLLLSDLLFRLMNEEYVILDRRISSTRLARVHITKVPLWAHKSLQCNGLHRRCNPLPLMPTSALTYGMYPWSVHCEYVLIQTFGIPSWFHSFYWTIVGKEKKIKIKFGEGKGRVDLLR